MNDIEIEIQVNVANLKPLMAFLKKNAKFKVKTHQVDEYFTPNHRNFLSVRPIAEWLRLRDANGHYSINYKKWYFDKNGRSYHCDEFESKVEDFKQIKKIFNALNFKPIVRVDKLRRIWIYKDYEISVDSVKKLGGFVEIEYVGKDNGINPKKITDEMVNFLKSLGCGKIKRNYVGYPFQLLFPEEIRYEDQ